MPRGVLPVLHDLLMRLNLVVLLLEWLLVVQFYAAVAVAEHFVATGVDAAAHTTSNPHTLLPTALPRPSSTCPLHLPSSPALRLPICTLDTASAHPLPCATATTLCSQPCFPCRVTGVAFAAVAYADSNRSPCPLPPPMLPLIA